MADPQQIRMLNRDELKFNPWNCNTMTEEEMVSLEASLKKEGAQNMAPVMVRLLKPGRMYQVIDGEHRVIAAGKLGWSVIPSIVTEMDDTQAKRLCLALNLVHGKINPIKLFDLLFSEWEGGTGKLSTRELEETFSHLIGQSWISRILQFRNLASPVKEEARKLFETQEGEILTTKHLLAISKLNREEDQMRFLKAAVATGVSVPTLEKMVDDYMMQSMHSDSQEVASGDLGIPPTEKKSQSSTDSLMECDCGSAYLINWRRKTASRIVNDGLVAKAVHINLISQDIRLRPGRQAGDALSPAGSP